MAKLFALLILQIFFVAPAFGATSPLAVSIIPPAQFPPSDFNVTGIRASVLYGEHRDVYGIDLAAIGNRTTGKFYGLAVAGGFNWNKGQVTALGAQIAGLANINQQKTNVIGLQFASLVNYNKGESSVTGIQFALANLTSHTTIYGFQVGLYNQAREVWGFQIGLINSTANLHGLQIGLLNFYEQGLFKISPFLNFGF